MATGTGLHLHGGVDEPWILLQLPPAVGMTMHYLQCDRRCRVGYERLKAVNEETEYIVHERDSVRTVVHFPPRKFSLDYDDREDNRKRFMEALDPLRLQHWHEPIPNWVGEGAYVKPWAWDGVTEMWKEPT